MQLLCFQIELLLKKATSEHTETFPIKINFPYSSKPKFTKPGCHIVHTAKIFHYISYKVQMCELYTLKTPMYILFNLELGGVPKIINLNFNYVGKETLKEHRCCSKVAK